MGRIVMPFSHALESERERWKGFRGALNRENQEVFDRLFDRAKFHTHASVYMAHSWPMETILVSICLEHGKMVGEILNKLKEREGGELREEKYSGRIRIWRIPFVDWKTYARKVFLRPIRRNCLNFESICKFIQKERPPLSWDVVGRRAPGIGGERLRR